MSISLINMGTGQVDDASAEQASRNIMCFIDEVGIAGLQAYRRDGLDSEGRFGYELRIGYKGEHRVSVLMPGCPLDQVRIDHGDSVRGVPRLYVDGSSWLWCYATGIASRGLMGDPE